jgi:26S proteasome regulatory subunit N6
MAAGDSARLQEAQGLVKTDPRKAEAIYKDITSKAPGASSDAATREYETALISLGELYRDEKLVELPYCFVALKLISCTLTGTHKN